MPCASMLQYIVLSSILGKKYTWSQLEKQYLCPKSAILLIYLDDDVASRLHDFISALWIHSFVYTHPLEILICGMMGLFDFCQRLFDSFSGHCITVRTVKIPTRV